MAMPGMPVPANKPKYSQMLVEVSPGKWEVIDKNGNAHKPTPGVLHHIGQMTAVKPYGGKLMLYGELKREGNVPASLQKLIAPSTHASALAALKVKPEVHTHRVLPPGSLPPGMGGSEHPPLHGAGALGAAPGGPPETPPGMPGMPTKPQAQQGTPMPGATLGAMQ